MNDAVVLYKASSDLYIYLDVIQNCIKVLRQKWENYISISLIVGQSIYLFIYFCHLAAYQCQLCFFTK